MSNSQLFFIEPAAGKPLFWLGAILTLLLGIMLLMGFFVYSARATRFEVSEEGLRVSRTLYGRTIPWSAIDAEGARQVDLRVTPELQPTLRTNGIGLPGYRAGWFRLRERGRALLFVTDPSKVVVIPTTAGYTVLLSVREPDRLLASIRTAANRPPTTR